MSLFYPLRSPSTALPTLLRRSSTSTFPLPAVLASLNRASFPRMDVINDKDKVTCVVELPGLKKEDVSVSLEDNVLSISGKVEHSSESAAKDASYQVSERSYGSFERKLAVPSGLQESEINASLVDGLLKVEFPKKKSTTKKIRIA